MELYDIIKRSESKTGNNDNINDTSSMFQDFTSVSLYTVRCLLLCISFRHARKRSQSSYSAGDHSTEQYRTEQDRTAQNRTGQSRTDDVRYKGISVELSTV